MSQSTPVAGVVSEIRVAILPSGALRLETTSGPDDSGDGLSETGYTSAPAGEGVRSAQAATANRPSTANNTERFMAASFLCGRHVTSIAAAGASGLRILQSVSAVKTAVSSSTVRALHR